MIPNASLAISVEHSPIKSTKRDVKNKTSNLFHGYVLPIDTDDVPIIIEAMQFKIGLASDSDNFKSNQKSESAILGKAMVIIGDIFVAADGDNGIFTG